MKKINKKIDKKFAACLRALVYPKTCSFRHLNKNISKQNFKIFLESRHIVLDRVSFEFMH